MTRGRWLRSRCVPPTPSIPVLTSHLLAVASAPGPCPAPGGGSQRGAPRQNDRGWSLVAWPVGPHGARVGWGWHVTRSRPPGCLLVNVGQQVKAGPEGNCRRSPLLGQVLSCHSHSLSCFPKRGCAHFPEQMFSSRPRQRADSSGLGTSRHPFQCVTPCC